MLLSSLQQKSGIILCFRYLGLLACKIYDKYLLYNWKTLMKNKLFARYLPMWVLWLPTTAHTATALIGNNCYAVFLDTDGRVTSVVRFILIWVTILISKKKLWLRHGHTIFLEKKRCFTFKQKAKVLTCIRRQVGTYLLIFRLTDA